MKTDAKELQELIASTRQKAFEDVIHLINSEAVKHGHNIIDMDAEYLCELIRSIDEKEGFKDEGEATFYTETK